MQLREHFKNVVAITGGAASGKSTVLQMFRRQGWSVASADEMAKHLFSDRPFHKLLAEYLEMKYPLDRVEMRERTFSDENFRRNLNRFFHLPVLDRLRESGADMVEVPLLVEITSVNWFGATVAVVCDPEDQSNRLTERLGSRELATNVLGSQVLQIAKSVCCDEEIRTSCSLEDVFSQTEKLSDTLRKHVSLSQV